MSCLSQGDGEQPRSHQAHPLSQLVHVHSGQHLHYLRQAAQLTVLARQAHARPFRYTRQKLREQNFYHFFLKTRLIS